MNVKNKKSLFSFICKIFCLMCPVDVLVERELLGARHGLYY